MHRTNGVRSGIVALGRTAGAVLVAGVLGATHPVEAQGDWPGWRGDGSGVSRETDLPAEWHELGYRWRTRIEGVGSSSPIVWGDRVFVTTSTERRMMDTLQGALKWFGMGGAALVAAMLGASAVGGLMRRRRSVAETRATWPRLLTGVDAVAVVSVTAYFFWILWDLLASRHLTFSPEEPDAAWIVGGETAVFGLLAAVGSLSIGSWWRLVGCAVLSGAGIVFHVWQPPTESTLPVGVDRQLGVLVPLAVGVLWLGAASLAVRVANRSGQSEGGQALGRARAFVVGSVAALTFGYYNGVEPELGMMREVWALDRDTGQVQWRVGTPAPSGRKYAYNTYATPTPVTNGSFVVADFGPIMVAVDVEGEIAWTREEPRYMRHLRYGAVRSPVIHKDTVLQLYVPENPGLDEGITGEQSYLAAFELESGNEVWRVEGIEGGHDAYSSPLLVPATGGGASVAVVVNGHAHGYDAGSGAELWKFSAPIAHPVPSPVADDRTLYIGGGLYGPQLGAAIDLGRFGRGKKLDGRGPARPVELRARWTTNRQTPDIGSVLVYRGLVYWVASDGRMFCYDAESGELAWRERLPGIFQPSPVAGDGKIFVQASDGRIIVLAAGPEFKQLAVNRLYEFGSSHASPAIAGGSLFFRGHDHLYAVGGESRVTTQ